MIKKLFNVVCVFVIVGVLITNIPVFASSVSTEIGRPLNGISGIAHAAHLRPTINYGDEVEAFNDLVGKNIAIVMYFLDWTGVSASQALDPFLLNQIQNQISEPSERPVVMLTWQPMKQNTSYGCTKTYDGVIPPADIIAGNCDAYITQFALDLKARSERFILRFAHEMNITDSPWWPGHFGGDASLYVQMYQHVYDVFSAQDVPNVEWIWSPNYGSNPTDEWNDLHNYYPGDSYVDWIGLSGFNWYISPGHSEPWRTFEFLFDDVLKDLTCTYAKPQMIAEIGSVEGGGSVPTKADWILDAYSKMGSYPFLRAVVWFNDYAYASPSYADFRVTTSTAQDGSVSPIPSGTNAWTNAYSTGISSATFTSVLPSLVDATPTNTICDYTEFIYMPIIMK